MNPKFHISRRSLLRHKRYSPPTRHSRLMSSLKYGNDPAYGNQLSDRNHYMQFVHLPHGITKLSGQGGWTEDGTIDANDWKGQIEKAFDNVELVLKTAGLSGWENVYLLRTYQTDMENHFRYLIDTMKKRIPHRPVYTALTVPRLGRKEMIIEIEVEAYRYPHT